MKSAKTKITATVKAYIQLYPEEFAAFKGQMKDLRHELKDEKFGTANDSNYMRAIIEMPAILHEMIVNTLNLEELEWFKSGGPDKHEGSHWFALNFPAFRLPDLI